MRIPQVGVGQGILSPAVGPWRSACSAREIRSGIDVDLRTRPGHVAGLAGAPAERLAGRQVQSEPASGLPVEVERGVVPEREMRGHADGLVAGVGDEGPAACAPGHQRTSPSPKRTPPGPSESAGPNGSRSTIRRAPSSRSTSSRISGTRFATPSSTGVDDATVVPAATTSSHAWPARADRCISSHTAPPPPARSAADRAPRSRASCAARNTRRRSSSVGFSCTERSIASRW